MLASFFHADNLSPSSYEARWNDRRCYSASHQLKMSWFFGRKKQHKESPPDSAEEEQPSNQSDGFELFPSWNPATPTNKGHDSTVPYPSGNLYPYVPAVSEFGQLLPPDSPKDDFNQGENPPHYLNGVPFKLCKRLEISANNDFEIDQLRISEILSFIERIESQNYDYSFSLEEGIMAEMNSRNNDE